MDKVIEDSIYYIQHLTEFFKSLSPREKSKFGQFLFPQKLYYKENEIYNPELHPIFRHIQAVGAVNISTGEALEGIFTHKNIAVVHSIKAEIVEKSWRELYRLVHDFEKYPNGKS